MTTEFKWTEQRLGAARLLASGDKKQPDICAEVGASVRTLRNWLGNATFREEVARLSASYSGVAESIRMRMERAADHHIVTREQIIGRLVEIANASLGDFVDSDGELDLIKARNSKKDHLLKEISVVKRTSKDGASRITKSFKIESPLTALDLLTEILGLKKQAMKNPVDSARESYEIMRRKQDYADVPDQALARLAQEAHGLPPSMIPDIMAGVTKR